VQQWGSEAVRKEMIMMKYCGVVSSDASGVASGVVKTNIYCTIQPHDIKPAYSQATSHRQTSGRRRET
jgi:hypothetical protein